MAADASSTASNVVVDPYRWLVSLRLRDRDIPGAPVIGTSFVGRRKSRTWLLLVDLAKELNFFGLYGIFLSQPVRVLPVHFRSLPKEPIII